MLAAMLLTVSVALGIMAFLASRSTTNEFERSVVGILRYRDPRIESKINLLQKYITQHQGEGTIWAALQQQIEQMASNSQVRFVMTNLAGYVHADSSRELVGDFLNLSQSKPFAVFLIEKEPILAFFEPLDAPNLQSIQDQFTRSVNRSLGLAILAAGLLALLITFILAQSILQPIGALTQATRKLEQGDLSQRVRTDSNGEVGELARAFNAMADSLERLEQLRRNMVTDVAHELRTPLSNIRGYLEALKDGMIQPTPKAMSSLHEEALLLSRLVDDLQELALAEAGQLHIQRQAVLVTDVIERAVLATGQAAQAKQIDLIIHAPASLPPIDTDPERLGQILRNLLNNAIAYTPNGGKISIVSQVNGDWLEIHIQDTGIGISAEDLPYVFERFYRADKSRTRSTGGAGLGLSIVKQLVEACGGKVTITSKINEGTTVILQLPIMTKNLIPPTLGIQVSSLARSSAKSPNPG
jgi:signal transduction histidine kinase